jgi:hypothetical protein
VTVAFVDAGVWAIDVPAARRKVVKAWVLLFMISPVEVGSSVAAADEQRYAEASNLRIP